MYIYLSNSLISDHKELHMPLTKGKIIKNLIGTEFVDLKDATKGVETTLEIIKQTLENGEDVLISGFGKFSVKDKRQRRGRNPKTNEDLLIDARRVVKFTCSGTLRRKINHDSQE
jgi:integration host factor subunit alpha